MFDVSWGELVLIGMVALIVIGPKELPTVLRTVGQWVTRIRRMAAEFQGQFQEAMREAEFADLKKQVESISDPSKLVSEYNPLTTAQKEIEGAFSGETGASTPVTTPSGEASAPAAITEPAVAPTPSGEPVAVTDPEAQPPALEPAAAEPAPQSATPSGEPVSPAPDGGRAA